LLVEQRLRRRGPVGEELLITAVHQAALGQPVAVIETSVAVTASVILAVSLARRVRRGVGVAAFVSLVTGVGSSGLTNGFDHVRGWQEHGEVAGVLARERLDVR
jgi:hypothetical protein